jgi:hypothetical protein
MYIVLYRRAVLTCSWVTLLFTLISLKHLRKFRRRFSSPIAMASLFHVQPVEWRCIVRSFCLSWYVTACLVKSCDMLMKGFHVWLSFKLSWRAELLDYELLGSSFCFLLFPPVQGTEMRTLRVRTHQQSRVESSLVRLTKTRQSLCGWPPRPCVHTSRVESSRVESSHTSLVESRVLMPHASFSSDSSDRAGRKKWIRPKHILL